MQKTELAATVSGDDDGYSVINTDDVTTEVNSLDDSDFDLVSDVASTHSFSPSISSSGHSMPAEHQDFSHARSGPI